MICPVCESAVEERHHTETPEEVERRVRGMVRCPTPEHRIPRTSCWAQCSCGFVRMERTSARLRVPGERMEFDVTEFGAEAIGLGIDDRDRGYRHGDPRLEILVQSFIDAARAEREVSS